MLHCHSGKANETTIFYYNERRIYVHIYELCLSRMYVVFINLFKTNLRLNHYTNVTDDLIAFLTSVGWVCSQDCRTLRSGQDWIVGGSVLLMLTRQVQSPIYMAGCSVARLVRSPHMVGCPKAGQHGSCGSIRYLLRGVWSPINGWMLGTGSASVLLPMQPTCFVSFSGN